MDESLRRESQSDVFSQPTQAKKAPFILLYGGANMIISMASIALATVLLPAQLAQIGAGTEAFSFLVAGGAVASVVANPLAGRWSDRTTSVLSRRRLWMIIGGI